MSTQIKVSSPDGSPIDPSQVSFEGRLGDQNYSGTMGELGTRNPDGSITLTSGDPGGTPALSPEGEDYDRGYKAAEAKYEAFRDSIRVVLKDLIDSFTK